MAVIALTSLCGAPGVTTTALAWSARSTRPTLIVEADVTGGSPILAGGLAGARAHDRSLLTLATTDPVDYVDAIWREAIALPQARSDRWVLPAIGRAIQEEAMRPVWPRLATVLRDISADTHVDVLVDAGRLGTAGSPWPLIAAADIVLLLVDATLPALNTLQAALPALRVDVQHAGPSTRLVVVPVVAGPASGGVLPWAGDGPLADVRPYTGTEIAAVTAPTAVLASIPHAPARAAVYAHARPPKLGHEHCRYVRAVDRLIGAAGDHVRTHQRLLATKGAAR